MPNIALDRLRDCFGPTGDTDSELAWFKVCRDVIADQLEGHFACKTAQCEAYSDGSDAPARLRDANQAGRSEERA